jgi:hypothetical protein
MADIVNLKQFRKRRERAERDEEAAAKRILFGRTKSEKQGQEKAEVRRGEEARRREA